MKPLLVLRAFLTALLVNVVISVGPVQAQIGTEELVTLSTVNPLSLSSKAQSTLDRLQKNGLIRQVQLVRMGNLAKIQKNGQLSFSLPLTVSD